MLRDLPEHFDWLEVEDYVLMAAVTLLPWAFGGVEIWAYRAAAALIAVAAGIAVAKRGLAALLPRGDSRWLLPALLLGGWAVLQVLPLPPALLGALSPTADAIYEEAYPGYRGDAPADIAAALEADALERAAEVPQLPAERLSDSGFRLEAAGRWSGWRALSLRPDATVERLFWFVALLLAFLLARARAATPIRGRAYRTVMLATFAALGMFALVQAATWNGKLFWIRELPPQRSPFGPYVNFVHFASAMELAVPWLAGYTFVKIRRPEGETMWRSIAPVAVGLTALCLIAGLAAPSKASAGLMLSTFTVVLLLGGASLLRDRGRLNRRWVIALVGSTAFAWIGAGLLLSLTRLGERIRIFLETRGATPLDEIHRLEVWKRSFAVIADYPVFGAGFGVFRDVFVGYLPRGEAKLWAQLHNDWLELLVDGGIVAGALVLWLGLGFLRRAWRGTRDTGSGELDLETVGLLLGVVSLSLHALGDFNHQIPANALLWVTASALLVARTTPRAEGAAPVARGRPWTRPRVVAGVLLVGLFAFRGVEGLVGGLSYPRAMKRIDAGEYEAALPLLARADVGFDRFQVLSVRAAVKGELWRARVGRPDEPDDNRALIASAARDYLLAAASNPVAAQPWRGLARIYDWIERREEGRSLFGVARPDDLPPGAGRAGRLAVGFAHRAIDASPNEFEYWDDLAMLLLGYGLHDEALEAVRTSARVQPAYNYHRYGLERDLPREVLEAFAAASRDALDGAPLLLRREHLVSLGKLEHQLGELERAETNLRAALEEPGSEVDRAEARYWLGITLRDQERFEEAEEPLRAAAESPALRRAAVVALADLAERTGRLREAMALLGEARRLQPRSIGYAIRFAEVARRVEEYPAAVEALKWVGILEPFDERSRELLIEIYIETGDRTSARLAVSELERLGGETPRTRRLREKLDRLGRAGQQRE